MTYQAAQKLSFKGSQEFELAALLDKPESEPKACALFAHCFTCSKDIAAAREIARALTKEGIAVLRFDFTGLGASEGEFAATNFSSNLNDLELAADYMRQNMEAPSLLIGHSLGGTAVLAVASRIPEVKAVVTIGSPSNAAHVLHTFDGSLDEIREKGQAEVILEARPFVIKEQFIADLEAQNVEAGLSSLKKALLVMHSPIDATVGVENAARIFEAAKHPKSFISLDDADHLLKRSRDAAYAARVIAAWSSRYM